MGRKKGSKLTPEHRAKIATSLLGNQNTKDHILSVEHRAKISAAGKGRKRSEETKAKIRAALKGRKPDPVAVRIAMQTRLENGWAHPVGSVVVRSCGRGVYRYIKVSEGGGFRKNWRQEHRFIMEQIIGRPLETDEQVHHIDGNSLNNHPSNLSLLSPREHYVVTQLACRVEKELAAVLVKTLLAKFPELTLKTKKL